MKQSLIIFIFIFVNSYANGQYKKKIYEGFTIPSETSKDLGLIGLHESYYILQKIKDDTLEYSIVLPNFDFYDLIKKDMDLSDIESYSMFMTNLETQSKSINVKKETSRRLQNFFRL